MPIILPYKNKTPVLGKNVFVAPNAALATLWADQLSGAGIDATVQRAWAGSIAGEIPVDQALPEVYVNGSLEHRLPGSLNLSFAFVEGEAVRLEIDRAHAPHAMVRILRNEQVPRSVVRQAQRLAQHHRVHRAHLRRSAAAATRASNAAFSAASPRTST